MSGTSEGAKKGAQTKLASDPEVFSKMGKKGGLVGKGWNHTKAARKQISQTKKGAKNEDPEVSA